MLRELVLVRLLLPHYLLLPRLLLVHGYNHLLRSHRHRSIFPNDINHVLNNHLGKLRVFYSLVLQSQSYNSISPNDIGLVYYRHLDTLGV